MFTVCKVLWNKNKMSKLTMLIGPMIILMIAILDATSDKEIYDYNSFFRYYWVMYFWLVIITEFTKETSIFSMPVKKKDIIKEYYICSLIYFMFYTFVNMVARIVVFKIYNTSIVPFESLGVLGLQKFLFLIISAFIILPIIILYKAWGMFLTIVLICIGYSIKLINLNYVFLIFKDKLLISVGVAILLSYISYKIALILFERKVCIK